MNNRDVIELMKKCKVEIARLRSQILILKSKADAYDSALAFLMQPPDREDLVQTLDKRILDVTKEEDDAIQDWAENHLYK